jgi:uncharacterized protein
MFWKYRKIIIGSFIILAIASAYFVTTLRVTFNFDQFFPEGDEDLEYFRNFIEEFETDDNFLLLALTRKEGVFDSLFLNQYHDLTIGLKALDYVDKSQSLSTFRYPIKTPFGVSSIPVINLNDPTRYYTDSIRLMEDVRFLNNFINEKATALSIAIKVKENISIYESEELIKSIRQLLKNYSFDDYHLLGRAYFQSEIVNYQKYEIFLSGVVSVILVSLIMIFLYRKWIGVTIAIVSIGLSLLLFMGLLGFLGRELSVMAALYPVLMLIVGTSDVVHIMTKYLDELHKGKARDEAMRISVRQIGVATLLTSLTTAAGFLSLMTSRLSTVRDFGLNAAIGVIVAYVTVIFFTTCLLTYFDKEQIAKSKGINGDWDKFLEKSFLFTVQKPGKILLFSSIILLLCFYGISKVSTNYRIESNLPENQKVSEDFKFFEREFSGFRPLEFAISLQGDYSIDNYEVVAEINKIEEYLQEEPSVNSIISLASFYKSMERMSKGNTKESYQFPADETDFEKYNSLMKRAGAGADFTVLVNKDGSKTRVSSKVADVGADSIKTITRNASRWIDENIDSTILSVRTTGSGLIIDKNAVYVTESLIKGLGLAILLISILMAMLLKNIRMLFIALIPNLVPLIFAASLLGFMHIELEAGISIIFAIVFGIAVDDTIHFLARYQIGRQAGCSVNDALLLTFRETGKAIIFTTIILFFGFLIMLFSDNPATRTVGGLISITLVSAVICDLYLLPVVMRKLLKD